METASRRLVVGLVLAAMIYSWPGRGGRGGCFVYLLLSLCGLSQEVHAGGD
jgi:hypothetical protein